MKIAKYLAIGLFLMGCSQNTVEQPVSITTWNDQKTESVLRVQWRSGNIVSHGSGFLINVRGKDFFVVAAHVVDEPNGKLYLFTEKRDAVSFSVVREIFRKDLDVAIFEVIGISQTIQRLPVGKAMVGSPVIAQGYPETKERVSIAGLILKHDLEASNAVLNGMSGGPLLSDGKVVGLVSSRVIIKGGIETSKHVDIQDVLDVINE